MTRTDAGRFILIAALLLAVCLAGGGCMKGVDPFPEPGGLDDSSQILRTEGRGPIVLSFASYPMRPGTPPDGVRAAIMKTIGSVPCSAATFYWTENERFRRWFGDQADERRARGLPVRLILAGHGLGATEACELAKDILYNDRDVEIVLLLTVDAVKTNRLGSAAAATGNVLTKRIPGIDHSFTAYDAAPEPDGKRLWSHVNYYQAKSTYYHGTAMPHAENHRLDDWTGLLNHGNADDFAYTFLLTDLRQALSEGSR